MIMHITRLLEEYHEQCPHCRVSLNTFTAHHIRYRDKPIYINGDNIHGALNKLTIEQKNSVIIECGYYTGHCPDCKIPLSSVDVVVMRKSNHADAVEYARFNRHIDLLNNYLCTMQDEAPWIMSVYATPAGLMQHHALNAVLESDEDYDTATKQVQAILPEAIKLCMCIKDVDTMHKLIS